EMHDGIVASWQGTVPRSACCNESGTSWDLLGCGDFYKAHPPVFGVNSATLSQGKFRLEVRPMFFDKVIDPETCGCIGAFLVGLRHIDYVSVQRDMEAIEQQQQHQARGNAILVVSCAPAPDISVFAHGCERINGPHLGLNADRVRMSHHQ